MTMFLICNHICYGEGDERKNLQYVEVANKSLYKMIEIVDSMVNNSVDSVAFAGYDMFVRMPDKSSPYGRISIANGFYPWDEDKIKYVTKYKDRMVYLLANEETIPVERYIKTAESGDYVVITRQAGRPYREYVCQYGIIYKKDLFEMEGLVYECVFYKKL